MEEECERQRKEQSNNGEWFYLGESDEWYWTGENEPEFTGDGFMCEAPTVEDLKLLTEEQEREIQAEMEAIEQKKREKRRKKEKERREALEALNKPLDPLLLRELCEYEKLRESIIKEREEAMAKCGFFQKLAKCKNWTHWRN